MPVLGNSCQIDQNQSARRAHCCRTEISNPNHSSLKLKSLLSQLTELETALQSFSIEELSIAEASQLKKSFEDFKTRFERNYWGEPNPQDELSVAKDDGEKESNRIIATVSHELRTPLNGIIGFADLLKETELSAEQEQQVNAIHSASRTLLEIINELLEYAKLKAGLENFETVNFKFHAVVEEVSYLCKTLIVDKDIAFNVSVDPNIPQNLVGDPAKLSQLLLNILGNSIKFVEEGSIDLEINQVSRKNEDLRLQFKIRDTGIGISKEDLSHIFESFRQANQDTFSKYGGSGLGLNIVKQIIERLNGEIEISSTVGEGTTVLLEIPYQVGSPKILKVDEDPISADSVRGLKILVFEDDQFNQWVLEKRLKSWGCEHFITENSNYGLKVLQENEIDLVLMDFHLPGTDGFNIAAKIRENPKAQVHNVPVIAISADIRIADEIKCQEHGIDDFILKPYTPEELLMKMISATRLHREGAYALKPLRSVKRSAQTSPSTIDLQPLLNECLGQVELMEELVGLYKKNVLEFIGQVKLHLQNEDIKGIEFASHKIKTGLKIISTPGLLGIAETLHAMSRELPDFVAMKSLFEAFVAHYPQVEKELEEELKRLKN